MKPIVTLDDVQDDEEQASKMNVSQPLFFLSFLIGSPAKNLAVFHQEPTMLNALMAAQTANSVRK